MNGAIVQTRTTLLIDKDAHARFKAVCKELGCSQAEFIGAVTQNPDIATLKPLIQAYQGTRKIDGRTSEASLVAKLKAMTPDARKAHLAALAAAVEA